MVGAAMPHPAGTMPEMAVDLDTPQRARGLSGALFALVARALADAARAEGLSPPAFRSPPNLPGAHRTARRLSADTVLVAVQRDRRPDAVIDDMVAGVLRANPPCADARAVAARLRAAVHAALQEGVANPPAYPPPR